MRILELTNLDGKPVAFNVSFITRVRLPFPNEFGGATHQAKAVVVDGAGNQGVRETYDFIVQQLKDADFL